MSTLAQFFFVKFQSKIRNNLKSNFPCLLKTLFFEKREKNIQSTLERSKKKIVEKRFMSMKRKALR